MHKSTDQERMTLDELTAIGETIFGPRWVKPLARAIGWDPRALRFWKDGERKISVAATAAIREFSDIGPAGEVIRAAIGTAMPNVKPWQAHAAARQALADLAKAGLLDDVR